MDFQQPDDVRRQVRKPPVRKLPAFTASSIVGKFTYQQVAGRRIAARCWSVSDRKYGSSTIWA
jgi:hypothetical protein